MQNITISGNLTADAKAFQDQNGRDFMSFHVAVNDMHKGEKTSTFYDVIAPKTGVFDYLKKGQGVIVSGPLTISTTDKDGKSYTNINVYARDLELSGSPRQDA